MKKRLLAALLVIAMMASMIVMPAYATESAEQYPAGYCQHCKQVIPEDQWIPWDITNTDPYSGHYYLAEDINAQESQISIILDDDLYRYVVCLDLRGHSYTVEGKRPFLIYGILSIMDSVGGGEIAVTGYTTKTNSYGGFCQLGKESVSKDGSGELNLYSGTIRKINADGHTTAKGGLIYAYSDATLNVYGGKLIGGQVTPRLDSKGAPINFVGGGTIFADNGNINIYGGTVTGGEADNTTLILSDGTTKSYDVYGGNIYAIGGSEVTISGGSVENGYSDTYGGNLCLRASTLEISGGTITGGYSAGAGGNIMLLDASTFKMSGGTIKNGVSIGRGGNLFVNKNLIDIEISGGEIYGDISIENYKSIKLSGSPKIYMGLSNGLRLQAAKATKMDISGLKQGAEIYLDGVDQVFTGVLENPETYLAYFKDAIRADISVDASGALRVDQGTTGFCPHCWKSGEQATWTVWGNKAGSASSGVYSITSSVHYYLSEDCVRNKPGKESGNRMGLVSAGSSSVKTNDVVIDTAGYTWTTTGNKVFNVRSTLSLVDSEGGGKIIATGKKTDAGNGGMIQVVNTTSVFNLYSGTLQRTISGDDYINDLMGGILYAPAGSSVNIYGGTIRDGVSASVSAAETDRACKGGNICALGNFTMTAGALIGGKTYNNSYIKQDTATPIVIDDKNVTLAGIGGNLYAAGETNISGGHIVEGTACQGGGIYIANTAEVNISDCVIRNNTAGETGGAVNSDFDPAYQGGNIYIAGTSSDRLELTLSDFILRSGNSKEQGGNIYADYADLTLRDILIADGNADTHGGNIYLPKTVVCDMYDSVIGNGVAGTNGGNLYGAKGVVFNLHSGLICGGTANTSGGNLHCTGLNMSGGIVTGGTAGDKGGNIYVLKSGNTLRIEDDGDSATPAPVFSNGSSASNGPNIYLGDSNTGYLTGAIIHGGGVYGYFNSSLILTDCSVDGIIADDSYGKGVYAGGALTLKGNTTVTNEQNKSCVYIHGNGSLTVDAGFTGAASVAFAESHFENAAAPQGSHVAEKNTAGGVFTGTLLLEDRGDYEYSLPAIFAVSGDNKLYIASTAIVDEETGEITWFKDAGSAAAELDDGEYLRLHATENTMELNRNVAVDLNGNKLTVSGEGTVYGFDSSNDDYDGYGTVEVIGTGVSFEPSYYAPNGNQYVTLADENGISFHRMGIRISSVSLRPSASGVYFEGMWECDDILADKIDTFGIALSVEKMPDNNFAADTKYTEHAKDDFVSGIAKTSVLVKNILKENEDNQARGTMEIYATPYVTVNSGIVNNLTIVCDDRNGTPDGVAWTLKDVMQAVNRIWPKLGDKQQAVVKGMYNGYADVLETWDLYNTTAAVNGTAAIRPLKILTLGHSLAVDSCHMLNMVAAAQGYSEEFIVGTLYYSGCQFYKHVNFLRDNSPVYSLYISNSKTPDAPPTIEEDITMEYGIKYDDWDIIIMQGGVFEISRESDMSNGNIQIIQDYVQEQKTNPNAILAYHMPWAPPVDNDLRDLYTKSPNSYYTNYTKYNDDRSALFAQMAYLSEKYIMTDSNFIYFIPSGTAIENALSSYLTEKDLHRDYVHVSDLGRLIASYTWYCTLAGIEKLDEVKVDAIPKQFLKSTKDKTQDRVLTEAEKAIILEAVNNALANPLEMTQSQYTTAPTN